MATTFKTLKGPAVDTSFVTETEITGGETTAGGIPITAANVGLQTITFGFGFIVGTTEEGEAGPKTSIPGVIYEGKLRFYDTATGKEIVTGKTFSKAKIIVYAFGPSRA